MNKISICFFSGDITRSGGTERVVSELINSLYDFNKYKFTILSLEMSKNETFFHIDENISLSTLYNVTGKASKNPIVTILKLRKFIVKNKIDILIDVDSLLDVFSVPATRFTKTKLISWEHFNFYENLGVKYRDWGRKLSSKFADSIVTITKEDKGYFEKELKPKCPVHQIYNPIKIQQTNNNYSIKSRTILSAGRLTHQKGFDYLIDVAYIVLKKHPEWEWIILGEGKDREMLQNKIDNYGLNNQVKLAGNVKNVDDYYKDASFFVLTSRYEGFGLVLTEAKSFKLPCVSFSCKAGPSEIIIDGINGFLVECFDIETMAQKVLLLIQSENLRQQFSDNSLIDTDKFNSKNVVSKWVELFDSLS